MISNSLLEVFFNLLYKLETLGLLAGCSVGLDFCCKTEVVMYPHHCFLASPPASLALTGLCCPQSRAMWPLTQLLSVPNSPHPARLGKAVSLHLWLNASSLTPPASSEGV